MATHHPKTLKDPVCLLMEYAAKSKIKVEFTDPVREGPDHSPRFVVASTVDGRRFPPGSGTNKKTAKKEAAKVALRTLLGEASNGESENGNCSQNGYDSDENGCKDPVSELMEHAHVVKATVDFTPVVRYGPDHRPVFCTAAIVDGKHYPEGCAGTKRQAKKEAAQLALEEIERNGSRTPTSESSQDSDSSRTNSINGKHPTSALMEFAQARGIQLTFLPPEVEGPDHIRRYQTAVVINGTVLPTGCGVSIKEAKKEAAFKAMALLSDPDYLQRVLRPRQTAERNGNTNDKAEKASTLTPKMLSILEEFRDKDPICALQEYCVPRRLTVNYIEYPATGPSHQPTFAIACSVAGRIFPKQISSQKQTAKKDAARIALGTILSEAHQHLRNASATAAERIPNNVKNSKTWGDYVAALSHNLLEILQDAQRDKFVKEKVLATIIVKKNKKDPGTVVSLGTGNRCILGKHLTQDGCKVHHSHAEVIARRSFLRYLYKQIKLYEKKGHSEVLEEKTSGKLRLKSNVSLHLYISRPPCGDASAFIDISNNPSKQRAMRRQGLLRTIMEDGEGAIPCISEPDEATFEQLTAGEKRLRVMTCSDKICRWNVLGLQGALLARFLEPVYLSSITIGSFRGQQLDHLPRAIFGRLQNEDEKPIENYLPSGYILNNPAVGSVSNSSAEIYDLCNSRQYSINWCEGDNTVEVVDGMSGEKVVGKGPETTSRVSKYALFQHFTEVHKGLRHMNGRSQILETYAEAKDKAVNYQAAKNTFIDWLSNLGYGPWIHLPHSGDTFTVSPTS